ncbi:MAG: FtsX-like permease family protein [Candidatus Aminicenantales bacterium]
MVLIPERGNNLAGLGLLGLAAFAVERRTKEIGIRKVLGASAPYLAFRLGGEFLGLVLIANVIAWPIAYFAMSRWLQDFAYRIGLSAWPFLLAAAGALVFALLTVSTQTFRAASANPVETLRYE